MKTEERSVPSDSIGCLAQRVGINVHSNGDHLYSHVLGYVCEGHVLTLCLSDELLMSHFLRPLLYSSVHLTVALEQQCDLVKKQDF